MSLEEFETGSAVIEPFGHGMDEEFEICDTLIFSFAADKIILPSSALRDEGTSYHYAPPSDEIAYDMGYIEYMEKILMKEGISCIRTKTWSTDAFYRETASKVQRRLAAGARVVDMEAAAIMAWSQFRQSVVYQFFYTADYVDHHKNEWDKQQEERQLDCMIFFDVAMILAKGIKYETL